MKLPFKPLMIGCRCGDIFSDILVVCEAMGLNYVMQEKVGPVFPEKIEGKKDIDALKIADGISDIHYTIEAIRLVKKELDGKLPLFGFAACPWTLFAYMLEGKGSKTFSVAKKCCINIPNGHMI